MLVVGDSLEVLTSPYLQRYLPSTHLTISAKGGYSSIQLFELFEEAYDPAQSVIVFDAGTNDNPAYPSILASRLEAVAKLVGNRCLVVPTIHGLTVNGITSAGKNLVVREFRLSARHTGAELGPGRRNASRFDAKRPSPSHGRRRGLPCPTDRAGGPAVRRALMASRLPRRRSVRILAMAVLVALGGAGGYIAGGRSGEDLRAARAAGARQGTARDGTRIPGGLSKRTSGWLPRDVSPGLPRAYTEFDAPASPGRGDRGARLESPAGAVVGCTAQPAAAQVGARAAGGGGQMVALPAGAWALLARWHVDHYDFFTAQGCGSTDTVQVS